MSDQPHYFYKDQLHSTDAGAGANRTILGHDDQLMMLKMDFEKGAVGTIHQHPHTQATYVLNGSFEFTIGQEKKVINKGDACFMPAEVPHGCTCLEAGSLLDVFTPERKDFLV